MLRLVLQCAWLVPHAARTQAVNDGMASLARNQAELRASRTQPAAAARPDKHKLAIDVLLKILINV
jgi:hypothetical protein